MALSTVHDVASHGTPQQTKNATSLEHITTHVSYSDKHFRPNPDAKPFVPNPFAVPPTNWHFIPNDNGKNVNGFIQPFWVQPAINPELHGNTSKKHIAFHLVSNVLDDEVPEDGSKELVQHFNLQPHMPIMQKDNSIHNSAMANVINTWLENESNNFNLTREGERSDNGSINNKSIHEIWSPDPSPNEINNLSPNDETLVSYNQSQLLHGPTGDSTDVSFEQVQNDMINQQMYNEINQDKMEGNTQPPYCYQNLPTSPIYQNPPFSYRNMPARQPPPPPPPHTEMYTVLSPRNNAVMGNNIRPVVLEPPRGYYPSLHYMNRYPVEGQQPKQRRSNNHRTNKEQHEPVLQIAYEPKICAEELGFCIDECRDQLKHLERDCKKADITLSQEFRLRKTSLGDSPSVKYPSNSSKVDKLIVDQQKEHQKVESLIGRIERLGFTPMHPNVGVTLDLWLTSIKELRNVRKNELTNINESLAYGISGGKSRTQSDAYNFVSSIKELTKLTRSARTIVWCAIQMLYGGNSGE